MVGEEEVACSLKKLTPILNKLTTCKKVFIPLIPRYLFGGCCRNPGHCTNTSTHDHPENMLKEHHRIRTAMKNHIIKNTHQTLRKNTRIIDIITPLTTPDNNTPTRTLAALRKITATDNVHLTHSGYHKLGMAVIYEGEGLLAEATAETKKKKKGSGRPCSYWRGFVVHDGIGTIGAAQWPCPTLAQAGTGKRGRGRGAYRGGRGNGGWRGGPGGRGGRHNPYKRAM
jgi:hypothetical protein